MPTWLITLVVISPLLEAQPADSRCAFSSAVQLHQSGDLTGAVREYQACLSSGPHQIEARSNLGAVFSRLGRYQDAIDQYREALKTAPTEMAGRLRFNLALAYYKSFQIPQAAAEFEGLNAAQPLDVNTALLLADCRLRMGQFKAVADLLAPLEPGQQGNQALDYVLGMALIRSDRVAEGRERVDRILSRGESAEGHFLLGSAMYVARDYPAAVQEFVKAIALNPKVPSLQSFYGQALLTTGDADGASAAFRKELAEYPNGYDANFQLASILAHRGNPEEAHALLERAVQVRPGSQEARDALAKGFRMGAPQQAAGGIAVGALAPAVRGLELSHPSKPVVLVFGSYTCPKLRGDAAALNKLFERYRGQVEFRLIYIREAHAAGGAEALWQSTINQREGISLKPAQTLTEKEEHANLCVRKLNFGFPVVVDSMEGGAEVAYDAWPSRVYLVGRDGRAAFNSRLGELDFQPEQLERVIRETLAKGIAYGRPH